MEYNHKEIESRWQKYWRDNDIYKAEINPAKKKFYVLDMFPYPSGAGLHVGHPLGYIASDIYSRFKRLQGFNVLHPMGYDAYGLPAEQYAIQTGQHPETTTSQKRPLPRILPAIAASSTKSGSRSTGVVRCAPATRIITNGRSGFSCRCSIIIMTALPTRLSP